MPDAETPKFRVSNVGDPIPSVDPEELKRKWNTKPGDREALVRAHRRKDTEAVGRRDLMLRTLATDKLDLLTPWKHGGGLDDAVFRVAATLPMHELRQYVYHLPGDSRTGYDPNAVVQKLIEETGIPHTWRPILTTQEGGFGYRTRRRGQPPPDPEHEAKWEPGNCCGPSGASVSPASRE